MWIVSSVSSVFYSVPVLLYGVRSVKKCDRDFFRVSWLFCRIRSTTAAVVLIAYPGIPAYILHGVIVFRVTPPVPHLQSHCRHYITWLRITVRAVAKTCPYRPKAFKKVKSWSRTRFRAKKSFLFLFVFSGRADCRYSKACL